MRGFTPIFKNFTLSESSRRRIYEHFFEIVCIVRNKERIFGFLLHRNDFAKSVYRVIPDTGFEIE